jgi:hypothetical protein
MHGIFLSRKGRNDNEELHNLYSSPDIVRHIKSRRMNWAGHVARMGEDIRVYMVLVGKPEGKRPLGRPRRRWEDGIRMDLREIAWGARTGYDWLRIGTVVSCCECGDEHSGSCATEAFFPGIDITNTPSSPTGF